MKKRLLGFFIIACMVLTMFPTSVFAADINALLVDTAASNSKVEDKIEKEGSEPLPDSSSSVPPDSVSAPNSSTSVPDSGTSMPPASTFLPDSSTSMPLASTSLPDSSSSVPPESISAPSSSVPKIDDEEKAENDALQAQLPSNKSSVLAEGTYGGCDWVVGDDYTLTISPTPSPASGLTSGVLFSPDEEEYHDVPWDTYQKQILKVVIKDGVKSGANLYYFLGGLEACTTMDLSGLDTTAATDMNFMFFYDRALKTITFGNKFDTSNVTNMGYMFNNCTELQKLDLSGFNTAKLTNMEYMFYECYSLQEIDFSGFNTAKVTNMGYMFNNCTELQKLDLSGFNTAKVTNMVGMFNGCLALKTLNLGDNFDTSAVSDMSSMFHNCSTLETLNLGDKFDTSAVDDMFSLFNNCTALKQLDLSNFNTGKVSNMAYMFSGCTALEKLDLSNFNTGRADNMANMFSSCTALKELDLSKFDASKVEDMSNMFSGCTALEKLDLSNFNTGRADNMAYMFSGCTALKELDISKLDTSKVEDMSYMFSACMELQKLDLSGFNTAKVTDMSYMFINCNKLDNLNLGDKFDTAAVTDMNSMFYGCNELQKLGLSGFNTAKVKDMSFMFTNCYKLDNLNLGDNFDTAAVTNMSAMFSKCEKLAEIDLAGFNTSKVENMQSMFFSCKALTELNISGFTTTSVQNMWSMFADCILLETLELGDNFNTSKVTSMNSMFSNCQMLKELDPSKFNTDNVTDMFDMFRACPELKALDISNFKIGDSTDITDMLKSNTFILKTDYYKKEMNSGTSAITLYDKASKDDLTTTDLDGTETNIKYMPQVITASLNDITLTGAMPDTEAEAFFESAKVFNNGTSLYDNRYGYAYPGAKITVDAKDLTKGIASVTVAKTGDEATKIEVINNAFTMPAYPVTVTAIMKLDVTAADFSYSLSAAPYDGTAKTVSVAAMPQKDLGKITIKYDGSTTAPTDAGTYAIKVSTTGSATHNAVTELSLGNFIINKVPYTADLTASKAIFVTGQEGATLTLPELPKGAKYGVLTASGDVEMTDLSIKNNALIFTAPASEDGKTGIVTIKVTNATNYNDYDVIVTIKYTTKVNIIWDNQGATTSQIGGSEVLNLDDNIVIPTSAPVKTGYAFGGWFTEADGKGTQITETSKAPARTKVTYYAKWTALKYTITGTVTQENKKPLSGAAVNLLKDGKSIMRTATKPNGEFNIVNVAYGEGYTIKVSKAMYIMQESEKFSLTDTVALDYEVSFKLKDLEKIISGVGENNPFYLSDLSNALSPEDVNVTKIELKVTPAPDISKEIKNEMESLGKANSITKYYDLSILKYIDEAASVITETNGLVKIVMPIDVDIQGNGAYELLRKHGNNSAEKITTTKNANGEYIEISPTFIAAYLKFFSVYAIQYTEEQAVTPPNAAKDYLLTLADTGDNSYGGGKMNIGDTVKIYAGTKQGYRFIGWETTNGGILADTTSAETTFKMVNGPCTLIARWVAIEGHSGKKNPSTGVSTEMPNNVLPLALPLALASIGGALLIVKRRKHN